MIILHLIVMSFQLAALVSQLSEFTSNTNLEQNVYAETTFVCPSYWLTEAFSNKGRTGYKYQYSVIGAQHGLDVVGYFGPPTPNQSPDFTRAFMCMPPLLSALLTFRFPRPNIINSDLGQFRHKRQPLHLCGCCCRVKRHVRGPGNVCSNEVPAFLCRTPVPAGSERDGWDTVLGNGR